MPGVADKVIDNKLITAIARLSMPTCLFVLSTAVVTGATQILDLRDRMTTQEASRTEARKSFEQRLAGLEANDKRDQLATLDIQIKLATVLAEVKSMKETVERMDRRRAELSPPARASNEIIHQ